jgi:hypothetical protein
VFLVRTFAGEERKRRWIDLVCSLAAWCFAVFMFESPSPSRQTRQEAACMVGRARATTIAALLTVRPYRTVRHVVYKIGLSDAVSICTILKIKFVTKKSVILHYVVV